MDQKDVERLIATLKAAGPVGGLTDDETSVLSRMQGQNYAGEESKSAPMMSGDNDAEPMETVGGNPASAFVPKALNDAGGPMGMGAQKMTPEEEAISAGLIANQHKRRAAKAF